MSKNPKFENPSIEVKNENTNKNSTSCHELKYYHNKT
jgi:hypothetical protein